MYFLSAIWLPHGQLSAIIERTDNLTYPMLITANWWFQSEGHREPRDEVGYLSPTEWLVRFESENFPILIATP